MSLDAVTALSLRIATRRPLLRLRVGCYDNNWLQSRQLGKLYSEMGELYNKIGKVLCVLPV